MCARRQDPFTDCLWLKWCCSGQGCFCPNCLSLDGMKQLMTPLQAGRTCCIQSACGCNPSGACFHCFPHPLTDLWCASKFCCLKSYCGVPFCGAPEAETWFQLCCLAIHKTEPRIIPFNKEGGGNNEGSKFCWFRCCCSGQGFECPGLCSGSIDGVMKPMSLAVMCCLLSECGIADSTKCPCGFPHPIEEEWCAQKFCCLHSYCGIGPCLAEPIQLCCIQLCPGMVGMGQAYNPASSKGAVKGNVSNII